MSSGDREIPTQESTVPTENEASHWIEGPEGWDFSVPLNTNDRLFLSHIQFYYIFGEVLCFTFDDVLYSR